MVHLDNTQPGLKLAGLLCLIALTACDSEPVEVISSGTNTDMIDTTRSDADTVVQTTGQTGDDQNSTDVASDVNSNTSDSDATGNNDTVPVTFEDITDLLLVTGQSNALGAGTTFDSNLDAPNDRVFAYTDIGWQVADLNQNWDRGLFPRNGLGDDPSNNFSFHFGKRLAERRSDRVVGFILITAPGEPISYWDEGGEFFELIRDKASRAINDLPYKSRLDGILWHQGESDGHNNNIYGDALYNLIGRFRSEPWFDDGLPFICGDTADLPVNYQLRRLNTDDDPWTACIEAEGLPTDSGGAHFTAESLRIMGRRYADTYIEMYLGD